MIRHWPDGSWAIQPAAASPVVEYRPVVCVECGITWPSHHDFLNHLAAIERHRDAESPTTTTE